MNFRLTKGNFLKTGAYIEGDSAVFTFAAEKEDECSIVLLDKSGNTTCVIDIPAEYSTGSLYSVRLHGFCGNEYAYYFRINGKRCIDPYATRIFGREKWNDKTRSDNGYEIACGIDSSDFDWKYDSFPEITRDRMKLYKLHVRGFSMDVSGNKKHKGTFEAVSDRINYIKKLGFTSILLMPVYEFEEMTIPVKHDIPEYAKPKYSLKDEQSVHTENDKVNFWGYTSGNYFAVKASYASDASDASNELRRLVERLHKNGAKLFMDRCYKHIFGKLDITFCSEDECVKQCDMIVAIGGDGTILKCSLKGCEFEKPILGINCGRLGFMASLEHSQLELLDKLFSGEYTLSRRMMLNVNVECGSEKKSYTALNDVAVTKADDCKIADFEVSKNGRLISSLRADGVILSTATGSTAYSMSAGGPIIEPEMKCIEFTQICAHSLFARSMILSEDSVMKVKCHTNSGSHAIVSVDGNNVFRLSAEDTVIVSKSKYFVEIIDISGGSFFSSINKKLMQPLKESAEDGI